MTNVIVQQRGCEICQQIKRCSPVPIKAVEGRRRGEEWLCAECTDLMIEEQVVEYYSELYDDEEEDF